MASTYTLNNGIELIGTGEQSGTWGDTTNTNFDLVDTALDGQVSILLAGAGSSGSPNNLPVSDGSASNGRNRMITFTDGTDLGATAYVQLTPNDSEKIIYVRNNLRGSRSIILFQGTYNASNDYEVPAGTTAVVYFDGAGSGAVAANVFNNAHFDALNVVGSVTVGGGVTVTGVLTATSLDISGDIDVDGTTNLDVVDIDGATQIDATVTVGVDDTGYDVKFFGDAASAYMLWDASQDDLILGGAARLGIGTTTPSTPIHIVSTTPEITYADTTGDLFKMGVNNGVFRLYNITDSRQDLAIGGTGAATFSGEIIAASLDISGDIDVDGTTNLDAVDIDGAVNMATTALVTGVLTTTAATVHTGGITMPDNAKAIFGAGSDLEIYHSGSDSYIREKGVGNLRITTDSQVLIAKHNDENMISAIADGAVTLYYNAAAKLATTSTGIDVTGTVTAAKLVSTDGVLELDDNGSHNGIINSPASLVLNIDSDNGATNEKFEIAKDRTSTTGGTVLFTVKEDGNVGIGVTSPTGILSISGADTTTNPQIRFMTGAATNLADAAISTTDDSGGTSLLIGSNQYYSGGSISRFTTGRSGSAINFGYTGTMKFYTGSGTAAPSEAMRIDASGNVIIQNTGGTLYTATAGTSNFRAGVNAGNSILSGGNYNTVVGDEAGTAIDTGDRNVLIGYAAGDAITAASDNTAVGYNNLANNTSGANNVALGSRSMQANLSGANNVAVGYQSLTLSEAGSNNTAVGHQAFTSLSYGSSVNSYNVAVGFDAGKNATSTVNSTYVGALSGGLGIITGNNNAAFGYLSGYDLTSGNANTLLGAYAGTNLTVGTDNVAVGTSALDVDIGGNKTVAIGRNALGAQTGTTGDMNNVAVGYGAGILVDTGHSNTFIGSGAGGNVTSGDSNIMIGKDIDAASATADNQLNIGGWITGDAGVISFDDKIIANISTSATAGATLLESYTGVGAYNTIGVLRSSAATVIGRGVEPSGSVANAFVASVTSNTTRSAIKVGSNEIVFSGSAAVNTTRGDAVTMTDRMTIETNGNVTIEDGNLVVGTAGHGIDFSAVTGGTGSATGNVLDDYEEGTWSPQVYYQNATDQGNATNTTQTGYYTKIGRVVTLDFRLIWTITGSPATDNIGVKNLPFVGDSSTYSYAGLGNPINNSTAINTLILSRPSDGGTMAIFATGDSVSNLGNVFGSGSAKEIRATMTYFTDA